MKSLWATSEALFASPKDLAVLVVVAADGVTAGGTRFFFSSYCFRVNTAADGVAAEGGAG